MKSINKIERGNGEALNGINVLSKNKTIPKVNEPRERALKILVNSLRPTNRHEMS